MELANHEMPENKNGLSWPPNYGEEFLKRWKKLKKLNTRKELRPLVMEYYRTHPADWINDWCITFDPRNAPPLPKVMPFILFPRQVEFINFLHGCLNDKQSGLVEKCRDVGASWLCVAYSVWLWLFHPGTAIGWGSRKEDYVDKKGDPKAIFPKIRQTIERLPRWMLPVGFNERLHSSHMKIINPANGSTITGEAGDSLGRGGRTTIYFKDESAHYERPELIEASLGDNTDVQIDISSVNGSNNVFYRRRMAGEVWTPDSTPTPGKVRVFIFDWRDHPGKTQAWYDDRRAKAEAEGMLHILAQEVDRDYSSAVDRLIIQPQWIRAAIDAHITLKHLGDFTASGERIAGQDVADEGGDKNALAIRHGVILKHCDHWGGDAGDAASIAVPLCVEHGVSELYYDSIGVGSGFKTGIKNLQEKGSFPERLRVYPWNAGGKVLDPNDHIIDGDIESPTNEQQFENLKAQSWWRTRTRFYKTYRAVTYGETYHPAELISLPSELPRLHEITMELAQAVHKYAKSGKTMVDKKPEGARSPNLAEAVIECYNPVRTLSILDVL